MARLPVHRSRWWLGDPAFRAPASRQTCLWHKFSPSAWATTVARARFSLIYTMASVTLIAGISIVPSIGFFKFAYDAISELALKHDEIEVSNSLEARRDRVRSYYGELQEDQTRTIDKIAQRRITETLDRYDKVASAEEQSEGFGFEYTNEPALDPNQSRPIDGASNANKTGSGAQSITESINTAIEIAIARAALVFPSNSLGSEMSKLGVASSEAEQYFFDEEEPNVFRMEWTRDSRLPSLTVRSRYPEWQGFTWRDSALVIDCFYHSGRLAFEYC